MIVVGGHAFGRTDRSHESGAEFYPMPLVPRSTVTDLAAVDWYRTVGFEPVFSTPGLAHARYARYADVLLQAGGERVSEPRGRGVSIRVNAREPVAAVA